MHYFDKIISVVGVGFLIVLFAFSSSSIYAKGPHCDEDPAAPPRGTETHGRHAPKHRCTSERQVAPYAKQPYNHRWCGYYVGGGAAVKGEVRCCNEGTWGWDYVGDPIRRRVALYWWHGRKEQGGTGAYKTDGPHVIKHLKESHASE